MSGNTCPQEPGSDGNVLIAESFEVLPSPMKMFHQWLRQDVKGALETRRTREGRRTPERPISGRHPPTASLNLERFTLCENEISLENELSEEKNATFPCQTNGELLMLLLSGRETPISRDTLRHELINHTLSDHNSTRDWLQLHSSKSME